jgi:galactokinase
MLRALRDAYDLDLSNTALAKLAQRVENTFVGMQCGLMDQMVIAAGQAGQAMFFDIGRDTIENVALPAGLAIHTIHSGPSRQLVDGAYNARRASCERAASDMGVESLRDAGLEDLARVSDDDDRAKAEHVIADNARVLDAVRAIKASDINALGDILYAGHDSLSRLFDVSTPRMDAMVAHAKDNGAIGARMTGAGFGGCIILLGDPESTEAASRAVRAAFDGSWLVAEMVF